MLTSTVVMGNLQTRTWCWFGHVDGGAMSRFVGPRLERGGVTEGCALNLNRGYDESR